MHFPFLSSDRVSPLRSARPPKHLVLGAHGEGIASEYLRSIGYSVRQRNIRLGRDEIDVIAWDPEDQVLVFAEVKTRTEKTRSGFNPDKTAAADKRRKLRRAARRWVAEHNFDGGYRIDLVCVQEGKVTNHFKELSWD
ncbi:YraN family protein [Candidatus Peregrinibacteria bacterium]|nr:YraN family protein [Candidatus Peregrinibacteria bacterium]